MLWHGGVGRLDEVDSVEDTDDLTVLRGGVLFRVPASVASVFFRIRDYRTESTTYTIVDTDDIIEATSGTFSIFLPSGVSVIGQAHTITNSGVGVITLDGNGNDINGSATRTLSTDESAECVWNGTEWRVI